MSERIVHVYIDGRRMSRGLEVRIAKTELGRLASALVVVDAYIWLTLPAKRRGAVTVIVDVFHRHVTMENGPVYRLAATLEGVWRDVAETAVECT